MCDVIGGTMAALSIASSGVSYYAQSEAANEQADYQNRMYSENGRIALENYFSGIGELNARAFQERAAASQEAVGIQDRIAAARATSAVIAGEAGVTGNSVTLLIQEFSRIENEANLDLQTNLQWQEDQRAAEMKALQAQAKGQVSAATPGPVSMPSPIAAGLSLANSLLGITDSAMYRQQRGPYNPEKRNSWFNGIGGSSRSIS
jgi:hypothetical protein